MPRASVLVVTYNARPFLPDLVDSLRGQTWRDFEVLVVDNASRDGTADWLHEHAPEVRVVPEPLNLGFAGGCNRGLAAARGEFVFLLNQDTVVDPRCLEELVRTLDADPAAGLCGAKMLFRHEPQILNSFGFAASRFLYVWDRGIFEFDEGQYDSRARVLGACAGALMVRRDVIRRIGGFDDDYFMYQEDVDLCLRAVLAGYRVALAPGARVYHRQTFEGHDAGHQAFRDPRNRLRTILKNVGLPALVWVVLGHLAYEFLVVGAALLRGHLRRAFGRIGAVLWNLLYLPQTWPKHERVRRRISDVRLLSMTLPTWRPRPRNRIPTYRAMWEERARSSGLPTTIAVESGTGLGYGWGERRGSTRRISNYGIAWLGPGRRLRIRAAGNGVARVVLNGTVVGLLAAGRALSDFEFEASGGPVNRILLRVEQGTLDVETIGWV